MNHFKVFLFSSCSDLLFMFVLIQKARVANQDLQIQLDQAEQEARDPNSKGNSLFAEVWYCKNLPIQLFFNKRVPSENRMI